ncbi:MAG: sigma-70 family RNA polymerase sigma factor [Planctomycetes bacterium]|nr:sigma-70 family RNA polymerase sigma factor [Planctomycetota bacterium]
MVLARLKSKAKRKLQPQQIIDLPQLDALLDVPADRFDAASEALAKEFFRAQAMLNVSGYRQLMAETANPTVVGDMPDVRGTAYQAELRRIPAMDRAEEFRMARRNDFVRGMVRRGLVMLKFSPEQVEELLHKPASAQVEAVSSTSAKGRTKLDREWFVRLLHQYEDLRNLYVEGALYIVLSTVNRYRGLGVDTADLIQEGNASLFQAIDGFDWRRDVRFRTYAQYWVHQAVLKMLYNSARTVRVPIWVQKILGKIRKAQEAGRREGREPTSTEIGARLGIPAERVEWVLATRRYAVSLDAEIKHEEGSSLVQLMPDESLEPIPESIQEGNLKEVLADVLADLPEREQRILRRRFGLDGAEPQTLGEIASELGITAERVRQLQNAAIGRIKKPNKLRQLQAFVE